MKLDFLYVCNHYFLKLLNFEAKNLVFSLVTLNIFYCQILYSNGVGSQVLATLVTTLPLITVVLAKSDSGFIFCLQSYQVLRIDRSLVYQSYPQNMINTQVIYRFASAQVECTS